MTGLSRTSERISPMPASSGSGIVRPGEDVVVDKDFDGPSIECGRLIVAPGVVVRGTVKASVVHVSGRVEGVVRLSGRKSYAVVEAGGSVEGEIHAASIEVRGEVDGILHASSVVLFASSRIDGGILTDSLINHPTARISGATFVGPGLVSNKAMLEGLRRMSLLVVPVARPSPAPASPTTETPAAAAMSGGADEVPDFDDDLFESEILRAAERRLDDALDPAPGDAVQPASVPESDSGSEAARTRDPVCPPSAFPFLVARRG